jgi:hypothetical protein
LRFWRTSASNSVSATVLADNLHKLVTRTNNITGTKYKITHLSDFNTLRSRVKHDLERALRALFIRVIGVKPHHRSTYASALKLEVSAGNYPGKQQPACTALQNAPYASFRFSLVSFFSRSGSIS